MNQKTLQPTVHRTWRLAWPLIVGNASIPLLGLADTAIAGRIPGATDLAAISLGASWITLLFWAFSFLRQSTGGADRAGGRPGRCGFAPRPRS